MEGLLLLDVNSHSVVSLKDTQISYILNSLMVAIDGSLDFLELVSQYVALRDYMISECRKQHPATQRQATFS